MLFCPDILKNDIQFNTKRILPHYASLPSQVQAAFSLTQVYFISGFRIDALTYSYDRSLWSSFFFERKAQHLSFLSTSDFFRNFPRYFLVFPKYNSFMFTNLKKEPEGITSFIHLEYFYHIIQNRYSSDQSSNNSFLSDLPAHPIASQARRWSLSVAQQFAPMCTKADPRETQRPL